MKEIRFIRDTREKDGHGYKWNKTNKVLGTDTKKLDVGDYSIDGFENRIVIERKGSPGELVHNLLSRDRSRFMSEIEKMANFEFAAVVCDFSIKDIEIFLYKLKSKTKHYLSLDQILGSIASIQAKYKIPFFFASNHKIGKAFTKKLLMKAHKSLVNKDV